MSNMRTTCPACHGSRLSEIYRLEAIPVQSCILLDTEEEARAFPSAPLILFFCDDCGFVFNSVFDPELVDYASTTEESQHFSGTFNQFAKSLVGEVASLYDLKDARTLEIGCGKGEFLRELVQQTGTVAHGVDPGFIPERLEVAGAMDITFQREYFDPTTIEQRPDFVVCRHTLEHIPDVGQFLADIATVTGSKGNVALFFETPDARRVLAEGAFWDIYYEHCSYFTLGSHARLFRSAGYDLTKLYLAFDNQYIIQYAEQADGRAHLSVEDDLAAVRELATAFPQTVRNSRERWIDFVRSRKRAGKSVAIWGGGSKCVSFITTNSLGRDVDKVIDINPFKQGKYLPHTAHCVVGPDSVSDDPPDTVIVMNQVYLPEISEKLISLGLSPELVAV
ncbi:MAG: class I SAM-dependent methyltransferase [Pseudomonadota bacterium]